MKRLWTILFLSLLTGPVHGVSFNRAQNLMGTVLEIEVEGDPSLSQEDLTQAFSVVRALENKWTLYRTQSELAQINQLGYLAQVKGSSETIALLKESRVIWKKTKGYFDPTAYHDGIGKIGLAAPPTRPSLNFKKGVQTSKEGLIHLRHPDVRLDFDGIAKGFALDRAQDALKEAGFSKGRLNFGGQILVFGDLSEELNPALLTAPSDPNQVVGTLMLTRGSIATSAAKADWNRSEERSAHIVNPKTRQELSFFGSVSAVASTGTQADAFSTALYAMGPDKGIKWANKNKVCAIYLTDAAGAWEPIVSQACADYEFKKSTKKE